uniref:Response regulatory domain-containing protein n=1 Tax=uncultured Desulfobacterium sp. TaxID=201089 RepID=E1YAR6_9BACT|nr:unknown protein [uncultured Desulfobacterium sp.]
MTIAIQILNFGIYGESMNIALKKILLVEDNANDVELAMEAFAETNIANAVDVAHDPRSLFPDT